MNKTDLLRQAKPILFNTQMVEAILEGRKTQTRRVVKPQPMDCTCEDCEKRDEIYFNASSGYIRCRNCNSAIYNGKGKFCFAPYNIGDILYVRETWCPVISVKNGKYEHIYGYRAGGTKSVNNGLIDIPITGWHPSIHMPKKAARIFLKVTDVRVQRLQDITVEECEKEGIYDDYKTHSREYRDLLKTKAYPETFARLWDSTVKKADRDKYGWEANPYVWVVEFERLEVEE